MWDSPSRASFGKVGSIMKRLRVPVAPRMVSSPRCCGRLCLWCRTAAHAARASGRPSSRTNTLPHNSELIEELRHYHRDENFKIVKQRDDLISAMRYAIMMRRSGQPRSGVDGVGFGAMPFAGQRAHRGFEQQVAKNVDFDVFTGQAFGE